MAAGALADIRSQGGNRQRCPYPLSLRTGGLRPPSAYVHDRTDALLDRTYSADFGDGRWPRGRAGRAGPRSVGEWEAEARAWYYAHPRSEGVNGGRANSHGRWRRGLVC